MAQADNASSLIEKEQPYPSMWRWQFIIALAFKFKYLSKRSMTEQQFKTLGVVGLLMVTVIVFACSLIDYKNTRHQLYELQQFVSSTNAYARSIDTSTPEYHEQPTVRVREAGITVQQTACFDNCRYQGYEGVPTQSVAHCTAECADTDQLFDQIEQKDAVQLLINASGLRYQQGSEEVKRTPDKLVR